jgi:hypothetical protein
VEGGAEEKTISNLCSSGLTDGKLQVDVYLEEVGAGMDSGKLEEVQADTTATA